VVAAIRIVRGLFYLFRKDSVDVAVSRMSLKKKLAAAVAGTAGLAVVACAPHPSSTTKAVEHARLRQPNNAGLNIFVQV
jgi:hypothetical protein